MILKSGFLLGARMLEGTHDEKKILTGKFIAKGKVGMEKVMQG